MDKRQQIMYIPNIAHLSNMCKSFNKEVQNESSEFEKNLQEKILAQYHPLKQDTFTHEHKA